MAGSDKWASVLGAALGAGSQTYYQLTQDEQEQKRRDEAVALQKQQIEGAEKERQARLLNMAIEGVKPGATVSQGLYDRAKAGGFEDRFKVNPAIAPTDVKFGANPYQGLGTAMEGLTIPGVEQSITRTPTLQEEAQQEQLALAQGKNKLLTQLNSGTGEDGIALTPQQRQRFAVELAGGSANGVLGTPQRTPQETDDDLVKALMKDPEGYHKLPAAVKSRIAGPLAAAGFKAFGKTPAFEEADSYRKEREIRVGNVAQELLNDANGLTTGLGGVLTGWVPGTPAHDWGKKLDTLKANIMSTELTAMRQASKTGGALGQVSDFEGRLLSSARAALAQSQSPAQVQQELSKLVAGFRQAEEMWAKALAQETEQDVPEDKPKVDKATEALGVQPGLLTNRGQVRTPGQPPMAPPAQSGVAPAQSGPTPQQGQKLIRMSEIEAMAGPNAAEAVAQFRAQGYAIVQDGKR